MQQTLHVYCVQHRVADYSWEEVPGDKKSQAVSIQEETAVARLAHAGQSFVSTACGLDEGFAILSLTTVGRLCSSGSEALVLDMGMDMSTIYTLSGLQPLFTYSLNSGFLGSPHTGLAR